jgi:hypothetical protein
VENRFFWGKIGAKIKNWENIPFFKEKRARMQPFSGASVWPTRTTGGACLGLLCIGVAAGGKTRHGSLWNA